MFVKICGLRDAQDVAAVVAAGAGAAGFVFAESVRRVTPAQARSAVRGTPRELLKVAVMRHPSAAEVQAVLDDFRPDVLQTDAGDLEALALPDDLTLWPVYREDDIRVAGTGTYLYEGAMSGAGETVDWDCAADVAGRGRMILAGGLAADNVGTAIERVRPWGVDVSSGVESRPGVKDHELIQQFVSAVRAAERRL